MQHHAATAAKLPTDMCSRPGLVALQAADQESLGCWLPRLLEAMTLATAAETSRTTTTAGPNLWHGPEKTNTVRRVGVFGAWFL